MDDEEELYREMNEEDSFYMGDRSYSNESGQNQVSKKKGANHYSPDNKLSVFDIVCVIIFFGGIFYFAFVSCG